jgi:hypothetical protein
MLQKPAVEVRDIVTVAVTDLVGEAVQLEVPDIWEEGDTNMDGAAVPVGMAVKL